MRGTEGKKGDEVKTNRKWNDVWVGKLSMSHESLSSGQAGGNLHINFMFDRGTVSYLLHESIFRNSLLVLGYNTVELTLHFSRKIEDFLTWRLLDMSFKLQICSTTRLQASISENSCNRAYSENELTDL